MKSIDTRDSLSLTFSALADPTRRAMLARLAQGEANVSDLAEPFLNDMSLPAVTKHLKVLENAGLISKSRQAQWRLCRLQTEPLRNAADWMEPYRKAWEDQLDRLGAYLQGHLQVPAKTQGAPHGDDQ
jgi:DNA-binding transcriptional ArsR family regulator